MAATGYTAVAVVVLVVSNVLCYLGNSTTWLHHKLRLPYLLSVSNRSPAAAASKARASKFWAFDVLDPRDPVESYFIGPYGLAAVRLVIMLYFTAGIVVAGVTGPGYGGAHWMVYFTDWSFVLIFVSAALGFANSLAYLATRNKHGSTPRGDPARVVDAYHLPSNGNEQTSSEQSQSSKLSPASSGHGKEQGSLVEMVDAGNGQRRCAPGDLEAGAAKSVGPANGSTQGHDAQKPGAPVARTSHGAVDRWTLLGKLHSLALELAATTSLLVTMFFWTFIADHDRHNVHPDDYYMHAANCCIMFVDVCCSRVSFASYHFQLMLLYGSVYEVFMWIYYGASGEWVYGVFNWERQTSVALYVLIPIVYAIIFYIWFGIAMLRNVIGRRIGCSRLDQR